MNKDDSPLDLSKFFNASTGKFKRVDEKPNGASGGIASPATVGLLAGAVDYLAGPILFGVDRAGNKDETSAVFAIAAGALIASIKDIRQLCSDDPEKIQDNQLNAVKAGAGGIFGGLTLTALTPQILLSLVDGGIVLGCTLAAVGFSAYRTYTKKKKYCKHEDCKTKGKCSQRVCRGCKRLFHPGETWLDCKTLFVDWFAIASFFDAQGLSYLDTEVLVEKHINDWKIDRQGDKVVVDCESFLNWVKNNKQNINSFKGLGDKQLGSQSIDSYLREKGL